MFFHYSITEWCRERCFFHCSIRNRAGNVVSFFATYGMLQETLFLSLLHTEWCSKRCFFLCSIRNTAGNVVSYSTPVESAETLSPYLNHLQNLSMLFLLTRNFLTFSKSVSKTFCVPSLICNSQNTITLWNHKLRHQGIRICSLRGKETELPPTWTRYDPGTVTNWCRSIS